MYGTSATAGAREKTQESAADGDHVLLLDELDPVGHQLRPAVEPARVHRPEAPLHVRHHLVLGVADAERRHEEEDQHDRRLRDEDQPVLVEPLVHEALAGLGDHSSSSSSPSAAPGHGLASRDMSGKSLRSGWPSNGSGSRSVTGQRVALERDAEHLGGLAFVPVRRGIDVRDRREHDLVGREPDLHAHVVVVRGREQVGDDLHPLLAEVHGGGEVAVVAVELGLVAQERHELAVPGRGHRDHAVPVLLLEGHDVVTELRAQARFDLRRRKRVS